MSQLRPKWNKNRELILKNKYLLDDEDSWDDVVSRLEKASGLDSGGLLDNFSFVPAGRILRNLGSEHEDKTFFNCYVESFEDVGDGIDSRSAIMDLFTRVFEISARGGGVGINFTPLRPKDSKVRGIDGNSTGTVSWMEAFDGLVEQISQQCLDGSTKIFTKNNGVMNISKVVNNKMIKKVWTNDGWKDITDRFNHGKVPMVKITTKNGHELTCSKDHKIRSVINNKDLFEMKSINGGLSVGDQIVLSPNREDCGNDYVELEDIDYEPPARASSNIKDVTFPKVLDEDLGFLLGQLFSDGHMGAYSNANYEIKISVSNSQEDVIKLNEKIIKDKFGIEPIIRNGDGACKIISMNSVRVLKWLNRNKLQKGSIPTELPLPTRIFKSPKSVQMAFVSGYFAGDGDNAGSKGGLRIRSISKRMLEDIKYLLLNNNILSTVKLMRKERGNWKKLYLLSVTFKSYSRWKKYLSKYTEKANRKDTNNLSSQRYSFNIDANEIGISDKVIRGVNHGSLSRYRISHENTEIKDKYKDIETLYPDEIISIEEVGEKTAYDLEVEDVHRYTANGIEVSNSRRGAYLIGLESWHPDIFDFIKVKSDLNKINNANLSVFASNDFMEAVKNDKDWDLVFPDTSWEHYDEKWDGNMKKWKEKDYPIEHYRTVKAKRIFDYITEHAWSEGEPGLVFLERYNNLNIPNQDERLVSTNPCFTGNMQLKTANGCKSFKWLEQNDSNPLIVTLDDKLSQGRVWYSGTKKTVIVRTTDGRHIECTPDQKFMDINKNMVEARNLKGIKLMPGITKPDKLDDRFIKLGFIQGDGNLTRVNSERHKGFGVNIGKKDDDIRRLFNNEEYTNNGNRTIYLKGFNEIIKDYGFSIKTLPNREFPKKYDNWTIKQKASFLNGCYSANGSVITGARVSYKTTCKEFANKLIDTLNKNFGIKAYITTNKSKNVEFEEGVYRCKESYNVDISRYQSLIKFHNNINFYHEYKQNSLKDLLIDRAVKVTSVRDNGKKEVYDFNEPKYNKGFVNNCVVSNCAELGLSKSGVCDLGSINLVKMLTGDRELDYDKLKQSVEYGVEFLDKMIDLNPYYLDSVKESQQKFRRIGLGIMGWADYLILKDIKYGSEESYKEAHKVLNLIQNYAFDKSSKLAKEKGQAPVWDGYMLDNKYIKQLDSEIKNRIRENGLRNTRILAVAPTGSISMLSGVSSGLEPNFAFEYIRNDVLGKRTIKHWVLEQDIDVSEEALVTTHDATDEQHVKMQATMQDYVDGSLSKCVSGDTLIQTNKGVFPIKSLGKNPNRDRFSEPLDDLKVLDKNGVWKEVTSFYNNGRDKSKIVYLQNRQEIQCSYQHKFLTSNGWKSAFELEKDDLLLTETSNSSHGLDYKDRYLNPVKIRKVEEGGMVNLYDIEVKDTHSYLIGNIISHNTINAPENATKEDTSKAFMLAYDTGCKGITYYRDKSRAGVLTKDEDEQMKITELEQMFEEYSDSIISHDVKIPREPPVKLYKRRDNHSKKWYFFIAFADRDKTRPFALFIKTNNYEHGDVADWVISKMERLVFSKGIDEELIDDLTKKYSGQSNIDKIARAIGLALRHNVQIIDIVNVLDSCEPEFSSLLFHIKKLLSKFITDGTKTEDSCPDCGEFLVYNDGCEFCPSCGYSAC